MIDKAQITVKAGDGGDGFVSFINVFYNPKGGPDGGNGGKGGSVVVVADPKVKTLGEYKYKKFLEAGNGVGGGKNYKYGKNGEDLIVRVPVGTVVKKVVDDSEEFVDDLNMPEKEVIVAKGGQGGLGNAHFKSSTNRQPKQFTNGKHGQEVGLIFELKLLSHVGLIGFPSVGKSTLLNSLANTKAKTASYHFTTLSPNLGVLNLGEGKSLVVSDLPGLIQGASKGKGLGEDFLRHVERCGILIHVLDPTQTETFYSYASSQKLDKKQLSKDLLANYKAIREELKVWSKKLLKKPEIVVINKLDVTEISDVSEYLQSQLQKNTGKEVYGISAVTKMGVDRLINKLKLDYENIIKTSESQLHKKQVEEDFNEITIENIPNKRIRYLDRSDIQEKLD